MKNKHSLLAVVLGALLAGCASDAQVQTELAPQRMQKFAVPSSLNFHMFN